MYGCMAPERIRSARQVKEAALFRRELHQLLVGGVLALIEGVPLSVKTYTDHRGDAALANPRAQSVSNGSRNDLSF